MDPWNFELGVKPLSVMTFETDISGYSQPPLYPLAIAPLAYPLAKIFNQFLAPRICFTILELIAFLLTAAFLAESSEISDRYKFSIMTIMAVSPLGFMAGTVMKQEEAIVMIFTAAVLLAWRRGSIKWAGLLTFFGMLTAKILFGITFLPLLLQSRDRQKVFSWGIIPSIIFFSVYGLAGHLKTGTIPFIDFTPIGIWFCVSSYSLISRLAYMTGPLMKWSSLSLIGLSSAGLLATVKKMKRPDFPLLYLLSYCILFLLFYHINTEYHIFFLPLLALIPFKTYASKFRIQLIILHFIFAICSWSYGIIHGINVYSRGDSFSSPSKQLVLDLYNRLLGFIPAGSAELFMLVATLLVLMLITSYTVRLIYADS